MTVRVQEGDFDSGHELREIGKDDAIGALVSFTGLVRNSSGGNLQALELECYHGMAEVALKQIENDACKRWDLLDCLIIHRIGKLALGDQIMMVATASPHRKDAFEAAEFLMDYLKSRAPFWKKEHGLEGTKWVDARVQDEESIARWDKRT